MTSWKTDPPVKFNRPEYNPPEAPQYFFSPTEAWAWQSGWTAGYLAALKALGADHE
jgi:hypothetical protein